MYTMENQNKSCYRSIKKRNIIRIGEELLKQNCCDYNGCSEYAKDLQEIQYKCNDAFGPDNLVKDDKGNIENTLCSELRDRKINALDKLKYFNAAGGKIRKSTKSNKSTNNKKVTKKTKKTNKRTKFLGGTPYQDILKHLLETDNIESGNYLLNFSDSKTLNFNVEFNNLDMKHGNDLNAYVVKSLSSTFKLPITEENIQTLFNSVDIFSFIDQKMKETITTDASIVKSGNPVDIVITRILYLLKREILSNNVHLNGETIISVDESSKETENIIIFTFVKYKNLLKQIKMLSPSLTNLQLFYILLFLTASGEELLGFFVRFNLNMNTQISDQIGNITFTATNVERDVPSNVMKYVTYYQDPINNLFKLSNTKVADAPNRTIIDYIYNMFDHYIKVVNEEVILTTYRSYFMELTLNKTSLAPNVPSILLGIAINKIEVNITNFTIKNTFEYSWTINTKTLLLLNKLNLNKLVPFFYDISPIYTSALKSSVYNMTGLKVPHFGYIKAKGGYSKKTKKPYKVRFSKTSKKNIKNNIKG